ncbi:hypothetical protein JCM10207_002648 [Rhodosporidiobolus poonsookiae]
MPRKHKTSSAHDEYDSRPSVFRSAAPLRPPSRSPSPPRRPRPYSSASHYAQPRRPRSPSPPRRPPPRTFVSEPPPLHVDGLLSAEEATRIMLQKFDIMDEQQARLAGYDDDSRGRLGGRRKKERARSVPLFDAPQRRRMSRVREYELWEPEREAIREAQVEMERRLDEEKVEHEREAARLEMEAMGQADFAFEATTATKKVGNRKATPRFVVSGPLDGCDAGDETDWFSGRRSTSTSLASRGSPPPRVDEFNSGVGDPRDEQHARWRSRRKEKKERLTRRAGAQCPLPSESPLLTTPFPEYASSAYRQNSPPARSGFSRPPSRRTSSLPPSRRPSSLPASCDSRPRSRRRPRPEGSDAEASEPARQSSLAPPSPPPSRSSRRRRPSPSSPSPSRTPRSPGKSPSPRSSDDEASRGQDLLSATAEAATAAVEQVGEAVSSALSRVLPSLFSSR